MSSTIWPTGACPGTAVMAGGHVPKDRPDGSSDAPRRVGSPRCATQAAPSLCYAFGMSNARKLGRPATREDLDALPENVSGEIIGGVLYTQPRPRAKHSRLEVSISSELSGPFDRGRNGPGGWWILAELGIELPEAAEVAPDIAGWRRDRLPQLPDGAITVVPDWVCEILSTNRGYDQRIKRPFYAQVGVPWLWFVDVEAKTLSVSRLEGGQWLEVGVYGAPDRAKIPPFEAIEIAVGEWWRDQD
jgi:Uma2 family endonuclease